MTGCSQEPVVLGFLKSNLNIETKQNIFSKFGDQKRGNQGQT
jgi:hypothetical protein